MTKVYNINGDHVFANSIELMAYIKMIVPPNIYRKIKKHPPFLKTNTTIVISDKLFKNMLSGYYDSDCVVRSIAENKNPIKFGIIKIFSYLCSIKIKQLWNARFSS